MDFARAVGDLSWRCILNSRHLVGLHDSSYGSGNIGNVPNAEPAKNNAVDAIGRSLVIRSVPKTLGGTFAKRSETKNAVWLFAESVRVTCGTTRLPDLSRS